MLRQSSTRTGALHSIADKRIVFHPRLPTDFKTICELALKMNATLDQEPLRECVVHWPGRSLAWEKRSGKNSGGRPEADARIICKNQWPSARELSYLFSAVSAHPRTSARYSGDAARSRHNRPGSAIYLGGDFGNG